MISEHGRLLSVSLFLLRAGGGGYIQVARETDVPDAYVRVVSQLQTVCFGGGNIIYDGGLLKELKRLICFLASRPVSYFLPFLVVFTGEGEPMLSVPPKLESLCR